MKHTMAACLVYWALRQDGLSHRMAIMAARRVFYGYDSIWEVL